MNFHSVWTPRSQKPCSGAFSADLQGYWPGSQVNGYTQGAEFVQVKNISFTLDMWLFPKHMVTVSF